MPFFITDQTKNLSRYLEYFKKESILEFKKSNLIEKKTVASINVDSKTDFSFFWNYEIFPKEIMSFLTQWHHENRKLRIGDIIIQHVFLPPLQLFSFKLIFGVIITDFYDGENKKSFTYKTLKGHAEIGEATFTIEKHSPLNATFTIHTYSKPNNKLPGIIQNFFSSLYQNFCTKMAVKNVQRKVTSKQH